jgi:hypothetical protein
MMQSLELLNKYYDGESIVDMARDLSEMLDEDFNPEVAHIPKDNNGIQHGSFRLIVQWNMAK